MTTHKPLRILAPTRYPWRFNGPRSSRHRIDNRRFVPFNYLSERIEGVTLFPPSLGRYDLVHAFNRIPIGRTPFVIGFESHLPRGFGMESTRYFAAMTAALVSERCRAIVAISQFARRMFLHQHREHPDRATLEAKLTVRLPSLPIADEPAPPPSAEPLRLLFVGSHFARKGGLVALRAAALARERGVPVELDIVSDYKHGGAIWTDPVDPAYYEPYWRLRDAPHVRSHGPLPNARVRALIREAHLVLLPTFGDTFGYSAIEALAEGVPVAATAQGALPEFIRDGETGMLLPLATDEHGEWEHLGAPDRGSARFERVHREAVEDLAAALADRLEHLFHDKGQLNAMRANALRRAASLFDPAHADRFWNELYMTSVASARG